ncbi:MAG: hypothetical protein LBE31_01475 [Deltaproteobacteria bacterium]|jgi:TRAP-type C4-dicarboxylate transport system permease small subunit|nr:hypothetical protein [Deltaproteobacteria bacterium]
MNNNLAKKKVKKDLLKWFILTCLFILIHYITATWYTFSDPSGQSTIDNVIAVFNLALMLGFVFGLIKIFINIKRLFSPNKRTVDNIIDNIGEKVDNNKVLSSVVNATSNAILIYQIVRTTLFTVLAGFCTYIWSEKTIRYIKAGISNNISVNILPVIAFLAFIIGLIVLIKHLKELNALSKTKKKDADAVDMRQPPDFNSNKL